MSRNHVQKMLIGIDTANVGVAATSGGVALAALTEGQIIAFDFDRANDNVNGGVGSTGNAVMPATTNIGFARGTAVLGEPILAGPIPVAGIREFYQNNFEAPVQKAYTLTVTTAPTEVGRGVVFKVIYHDNLSIIPNQVKSTIISVEATAANIASPTAWAAAIAAEFNLQKSELGGNLFVDVSAAAAVITFTGLILITQSKYNHIDRPEYVNFEVGYPTDEVEDGVYALVQTGTPALGQGDPAKIAWLEEQHMGRLGYADRRMWNDTKKYQSQLIAGVTEYTQLVINADEWAEGDMQGLRANPTGVVIAQEAVALILVDLARAGIVPDVIPASL